MSEAADKINAAWRGGDKLFLLSKMREIARPGRTPPRTPPPSASWRCPVTDRPAIATYLARPASHRACAADVRNGDSDRSIHPIRSLRLGAFAPEENRHAATRRHSLDVRVHCR